MAFIEIMFQRLRDSKASPVLKEVGTSGVSDVSGQTLLLDIGSVQTVLRKHVVQKGDRVVLIGTNSAKWIAADLGILSWGAICVPMYHRQEIQELVFMIQDCEPKVVLCADEHIAGQLAKKLEASTPILAFDQTFSSPSLPRVNPISPQDCVTFCYTSGTSGNPKGVMISSANIEYMLRQTRDRLLSTLKKNTQERVFHFLPFCFMGSRIMLLTQLYRGQTLWLSTDMNNLKHELQVSDPDYYLNVPAVLERIRTGVEDLMAKKSVLLQGLYQKAKTDDGLLALLGKQLVMKAIKKKIGRRLQFLVCGSAPLRLETQEWFQSIGIPVLQVYGLTETTAIITMDKIGHVSAGYVGSPIPGCEVKLSPEGELLCKGPNVFMGYWKREEETKSMLQEGWLHTGDQAVVDNEGRYKILGRVKNLLVSESGHNIAPEPLEEKLMGLCNGAEHVVVIGHAKPFLTAIVTGKTSSDQVQSAIDTFNQTIPHYRKIKKFYLSPETLTVEKGLLTANQKLRRKVIEEYFQQPIQDMYRGEGKSL